MEGKACLEPVLRTAAADSFAALGDGLDFVWSEQDRIHQSGDSKVSEGGAGTDSSASGDNASSNDGDGAGVAASVSPDSEQGRLLAVAERHQRMAVRLVGPCVSACS